MCSEVRPISQIGTTSQHWICIEEGWVWRRIWIQWLEIHVKKNTGLQLLWLLSADLECVWIDHRVKTTRCVNKPPRVRLLCQTSCLARTRQNPLCVMGRQCYILYPKFASSVEDDHKACNWFWFFADKFLLYQGPYNEVSSQDSELQVKYLRWLWFHRWILNMLCKVHMWLCHSYLSPSFTTLLNILWR